MRLFSPQADRASGIRRRSLPRLAAALAAPAIVARPAQAAIISGWRLAGVCSWYGPGFHGRRMANGRIFDQESDSAAHRWLPFGTRLLVRSVDTGREATVEIEDRGPFIAGRMLDVSRGTARELGMLEAGLARVECRIL